MLEIYYLLTIAILLKPNSEIVGRLIGLFDNDLTTTLVFSTQTEIEIPKKSLSQDSLKSMIGERIGLINCDENYKIRKIQSKTKKENLIGTIEEKNTSFNNIFLDKPNPEKSLYYKKTKRKK